MFTTGQIELSYDCVSPPDWRWLKACETHIRGDTLPDAALRSGMAPAAARSGMHSLDSRERANRSADGWVIG